MRRRFSRFMIRFVSDPDGDIGVSVFGGLVTAIKYKDSVLFFWFVKYPDADKYQGVKS